MQRHWTVFWSCSAALLVVGWGRSLTSDPQMKNNIKMQIETINARIKAHKDELQMFPHMVLLQPELPRDRPVEGLVSVVETLSVFQKVLGGLPRGHLSAVRGGLAVLQGYLEQRMEHQCGAQSNPAAQRVLEASIRGPYHVTMGRATLDRLQSYLKKLSASLDKLWTC